MSRRKRLLFLTAALLLLAAARDAHACSCAMRGPVLDEYEWADVVVVARAVAVERVGPDKTAPEGRMSDGETYVAGVRSTTMRVEQVFKGPLKVGEEMTFAQGGGADCVWTFSEKSVGVRYLFYLKTLKDSSVWVAGTCGRSRSFEYAGDDLLYLNKMEKVRGKTRVSGTLVFGWGDVPDMSVAGRTVIVSGGGQTHKLKTDASGVYEIYDLPPGRYTVEPEVPRGWKPNAYSPRHARSATAEAAAEGAAKFPFVVEAKRHTYVDIRFEIDNSIRGRVFDPDGRPMKDVCVTASPVERERGGGDFDCTEADGSFVIDELARGSYVLVVNDDGRVTSTEPFGTFYYPNVKERERAAVIEIGAGDHLEGFDVRVPAAAETVVVEGRLLYSDGKPVEQERVEFKVGGEEEESEADAGDSTDAEGRFSFRVLKGRKGRLFGEMYTYSGEYVNCPKLEALIKKSGEDVPEIRTQVIEFEAAGDLRGVELRFPFPRCKKAPE